MTATSWWLLGLWLLCFAGWSESLSRDKRQTQRIEHLERMVRLLGSRLRKLDGRSDDAAE